MRKFVYLFSILMCAGVLALVNTGCSAKFKSAYHLNRANRYFTAGNYDAASIEYQKVLRTDPQSAKAWGRLGIIFFDEGRMAQVLPVLTRAAQLDANNLDVRIKLGEVYLTVAKMKEARAEAEFVLERNPKDSTAPILLAESAFSTNDIESVRQRLKRLQQAGDSAPLEVALGTLAYRQKDLQAAEADFKRAVALDPKSADAYSALGNLYLTVQDVKKAEPAFRQAATLAPPRSGKRLQYAQLKIAMGDPAGGKRLLQEIVKKTPDYLPAWLGLAKLAVTETNYADCAACLGNVLSRDPGNYDGLLLQNGLELAQGKTADAIAGFVRMARIYPQASHVRYQLALAYLANQDTAKAMTSLGQALSLEPRFAEAALLLAQLQIKSGRASSAVVALKRLSQQQPQLVQARLLLASAYQSQGDLDGAIQIYRGLQRDYPRNPEVPTLLGAAYVQQKKDDQAAQAFDQALQLAPDYLPALQQAVNLDLLRKQYPAALRRLQPLAQKFPKSVAVQVLLAKVFTAQGDTKQAEATLLSAIKAQPESQALYLTLAQLYVNTHQDQKALANIQAALAKNPKDTAALMLKGMICGNNQNYPEARDAYEAVLAVDPNNGMALNNLAYLCAEHLGQLDKGYSLARKARDLFPADPAIADTLGWILYRQGQYAPALNLFQESAAKLYSEAEVQFHLGMAYYSLDNEAQARSSLERSLQLRPDFPETNECRQCLEILAIDPKTAGAVARGTLDKRLAAQPNDVAALTRLAAIEQRDGDKTGAIKSYEAVLKVNPQNVMAMINLAQLYAMDPQGLQQGFTLAKNAYQLLPNDPTVTLVLGRLAYRTGDYKWAFNLLQQSAQSKPGDPSVLLDLARAAYSVGQVSDAESALRGALQAPSFPQAAEARRFLDLLGLAANPAQALASAARVEGILKTEPDYVPALMAKAVIAQQKSDFAAAELTYENVLKVYPDFTPAQRQLAILYAENPANDKQAYALAVKARAAYPNDADLAKALGMIVYRTAASPDDYARAARLLSESAQKRTQDADLIYYLGMAEYHLKHSAECKADLQRALKLDLTGNFAADARKVLAELK
ncbi:MAG: tetratricopeptide repeat protein [Verrucomicrobiota bacterium]|nr:tetratricopeptide repeat protein [Verrucomicrobiota bacterium]